MLAVLLVAVAHKAQHRLGRAEEGARSGAQALSVVPTDREQAPYRIRAGAHQLPSGVHQQVASQPRAALSQLRAEALVAEQAESRREEEFQRVAEQRAERLQPAQQRVVLRREG